MIPGQPAERAAGAIRAEKTALRVRLRADLRGLTAEERRGASLLACARLREQPLWKKARRVLFYAALPDELDLWPLAGEMIGEGRTVALPRFLAGSGSYGAAVIERPEEDLTPGNLGVIEPAAYCQPIPLNQLDLVLVPGVGFDMNGRRLGRGKGYYDRLLSSVCGVRCGVAMDRQVLPAIPAEPHDEILDCILTPSRWLTCGPRAV